MGFISYFNMVYTRYSTSYQPLIHSPADGDKVKKGLPTDCLIYVDNLLVETMVEPIMLNPLVETSMCGYVVETVLITHDRDINRILTYVDRL